MKVLGLDIGDVRSVDFERLRAADPTYDHVGSTLVPADGGSGTRYEDQVVLGTGEAAVARARHALRAWRPQRALGASITPSDVAPDLDETVVLGLGIGPLRLAVPNRIVAVVDEPDRYGYAYGTLPGHPEQGEELFLVEMAEDETVTCTIRVDARPADRLRRLGAVIHPLQRFALRRYLAAIAQA